MGFTWPDRLLRGADLAQLTPRTVSDAPVHDPRNMADGQAQGAKGIERGSDFRALNELPLIQRSIERAIPDDRPDVIPCLHERDSFYENLRVRYSGFLIPSRDA
jgi:hypothetical protein